MERARIFACAEVLCCLSEEVVAADEVLSQPDQASSQQSSQQSSQRSRHHSSFQLPPADHLGASESASSSSDLSHTWQDPSVMTPRQLAVEQLLSRKLHALPSQQATVSQPADVSTPGTLTSPEPDTARGPDAVLRADGQSEAETGRLQVL